MTRWDRLPPARPHSCLGSPFPSAVPHQHLLPPAPGEQGLSRRPPECRRGRESNIPFPQKTQQNNQSAAQPRCRILHKHLVVKTLEPGQPERPDSRGFPSRLDEMGWGPLARGCEDMACRPRDGNLVHRHGKEGAGVSAGSGPCSCPLPSASWLQQDLRGCGCARGDRICRRRDTANTYEKILLS